MFQNTVSNFHYFKINDIETYFDYYKKEVRGHDSKIIMSKLFYTTNNIFFDCKTYLSHSILLNIEITTDGSYVIEKPEKYLPKDNEILFLLENEDTDFLGGSQQLKFKIGNQIKRSILDKKINPILIIEFLKCNVIKLKRIPEDDYFLEAFENEINK